MKNRHGRLEHRFLHKFEMKFNMFCNLQIYQLKSVSSFYEGKGIKPYSTKQLLNMFQLWCE